jgi:hypothetical protein
MDMNLILNSKEYAALSKKQHGTGKISAMDFLRDKEKLARSIDKELTGAETEYMKVLLYAAALGAAPFGTGGEKILLDMFNIDKRERSLQIAKNAGLSSLLLDDLGKECLGDDTTVQRQILIMIDMVTVYLPAMTEEVIEEISSDVISHSSPGMVFCSDELMDKYVLKPEEREIAPEDSKKIALQETQMRKAIALAQSRWMKDADIWPFLIGKKESDLLSDAASAY